MGALPFEEALEQVCRELVRRDVLHEPIEDCARFYGDNVLPFRHAVQRRQGVPQRVFRMQREGCDPLLSYLRSHQNRPTEVAGEKPRSHMHDLLRDDIWQYPECAGFPENVHSFREVELLLRPENQLDLQLKGEQRKWPLTVVDNIIYESGRHKLSLIGVISSDLHELREREVKPLMRAARYCGHNWGIMPDLYLALPAAPPEPGDGLYAVPSSPPLLFNIEGPRVPKRYLGVFK